MKPLTELKKEDIRDLRLILLDVDGVTIELGTKIHQEETSSEAILNIRTHLLSDSMRDKILLLKKHYFIAISSGRSSMYLTQVFSELLWDNVALQSEIGIFTLIKGELIQHQKFDEKTLQKMRNILVDLQKLRKNKREDISGFEPKQFLITLHAYKELPEVYKIMKKNDPEEEFYCLWNGEAFDIAPKTLTKGTGLKWLVNHLGYEISQTMAIGNGPNDQEMVDTAGIGVTTNREAIKTADFYTTGALHLGGEELVDKLLELATEM